MGRTTTTSNNTSTNNNNFAPADAFLRLSVVDKNGNTHRLPKDLALYVRNRISNSLIEKAKLDGETEFKLVGSVVIVDNNPTPIEL